MRTVFRRDGGVARVYDGLAFASWSPVLDDTDLAGVDLDVSNNVKTLEPFQFPKFVGESTLRKRIHIIKKSMTTINTIKQ